MTLTELIKELQEMQGYTDEVHIGTDSFYLSEIKGVEMNTYEGQPLGVIIRMKKDDDL